MHDWLERFEQAEQSIAITISSRLSGSMISAELARETALGRWPEKRIAVLDSRSTGPELVLCVFSVLSFSFGKRSVLSFLSGKEKKEPKKRNLNGEGNARSPSGGPPPRICFLFFPAGLFFEKPRKIYFAGNPSAADGRAQRYCPSGFMAFFSGSLFASGKKREQCREKQRGVSGEKSPFCL